MHLQLTYSAVVSWVTKNHHGALRSSKFHHLLTILPHALIDKNVRTPYLWRKAVESLLA